MTVAQQQRYITLKDMIAIGAIKPLHTHIGSIEHFSSLFGSVGMCINEKDITKWVESPFGSYSDLIYLLEVKNPSLATVLRNGDDSKKILNNEEYINLFIHLYSGTKMSLVDKIVQGCRA